MNLDKLQPDWIAELRKREKELKKLPRRKQLQHLFNIWFAWYEKNIPSGKAKKS